MRAPKYDPETYLPEQSYAVKQLSRHDIEVAGVVIYLIAMTVLFAVALVFMLFGEASVTRAQASLTHTRLASTYQQGRQSQAVVHD